MSRLRTPSDLRVGAAIGSLARMGSGYVCVTWGVMGSMNVNNAGGEFGWGLLCEGVYPWVCFGEDVPPRHGSSISP